jgi:H+/Cl- antiporter ClcA
MGLRSVASIRERIAMIELILCSLAGAVAGAFGVLVVQAFIKIQKLNRDL